LTPDFFNLITFLLQDYQFFKYTENELLGFIIDTLLKTFSPLIPADIFDKEFLKNWQFTAGLCAFGVFGFNIKPYNDRHKVSPAIINALKFIAQRELTAQITKMQAQMEYQALIKKVISEVTLNDNIGQQLNTNQQQTPEVE
jgi:hypothetical protein